MWAEPKIDDIKAPEKGSLVSGPFGSNISSKFFVESGVPVIRNNNLSLGKEKYIDEGYVFITEKKAKELWNCNSTENDIILTAAGTLGQVGIIPRKRRYGTYIISNKQIRLRLNKNLCYPMYVYYYLSSKHMRDFIISQNKGSSVPLLTLGIVKNIKVRIPSLPIQRKIAAILSAYDDLMENNKRRIALLEKMAEEIYREWFVRMRFPGHEKVKLNKGVPKNWKKKRFGDFCMLKRGYDLPESKIEPGEYPIIASTSIKAFHNKYKAEPPVITTGRSGSLGTVLLTQQQAWPLNTTLYVKNYFGNSPYFVYYTMKNMGLENFNSGAGVPTLNRNHINGISIAVPPKTLQKGFDTTLLAINKNKVAIEKSIGVLKKSRDLLLGRLISGKILVDSLDIQYPPSMQDEQDVDHAELHLRR